MLNNSYTKTNTIFGQALGCTALDDAFVKLLSDVNADGVTQFLIRAPAALGQLEPFRRENEDRCPNQF